MRTILAIVLATNLAAAGPKPGDEGTPEFQKAAALVQQLGDKRYVTREAAAKQLIEMGPAAFRALTAGTKSDDEEVRNRSTALLPQVRAAEWKRRAEAYLNDVDGKEKHDLPLLAEWEKTVGKSDASSRRLFAAMLRTNGELLEQAAMNPTVARESVKARCQTLTSGLSIEVMQAPADSVDLATLFFVHGRLSKERLVSTTFDHPAYLLFNPGFAEAIADKAIGPAFRRVVAEWANTQPADDTTCHQYFAFTVRRSPFPEAVPVLTRMANDKDAMGISVRAVAIQALGKIGDKDAKSALEGLITDSTPIDRRLNGEAYTAGDFAFAALVTAHGKRPKDYGVSGGPLVCFGFGPQLEVFAVDLESFPDDHARQKGLKKWKEETGKK
jgi:hypothetical protein